MKFRLRHMRAGGAGKVGASALFPPDLDNISTRIGSEYAAHKVFAEIARHRGRGVAQKIFAKLGKNPGRHDPANPKEIKDRRLLDMYDSWRSIDKTAWFCSDENKMLPPEEQYGAGKANKDYEGLKQHLKRLISTRKKQMKGYH